MFFRGVGVGATFALAGCGVFIATPGTLHDSNMAERLSGSLSDGTLSLKGEYSLIDSYAQGLLPRTNTTPDVGCDSAWRAVLCVVLPTLHERDIFVLQTMDYNCHKQNLIPFLAFQYLHRMFASPFGSKLWNIDGALTSYFSRLCRVWQQFPPPSGCPDSP